MTAIELLIDLARRPQEVAGPLREVLTAELVNAHPHHDNSIAWLFWHSGRVIDEQFSELAGSEPLWTARGFAERFALALDSNDHGYGHTPEQARAVIVKSPALLFEYFDAAIDAQVAYLETLTDSDLDRVIDENWDPPVTLGVRMVSITMDAAQHIAQAAYIAGIGDEAFE
ncbi:MAG: mycothiol transferase [Leucobacter sp.]